MRKLTPILVLAMVAFFTVSLFPQPGNFSTSLHKNRTGKNWWYKAENGGFESLTGISMEHENMKCYLCHGPTDADGNAYPSDYSPGCIDCHPGSNPSNPVDQNQCLSCHGRQKAELTHYPNDVHRAANKVCWDCHGTEDIHGDGTEYNSMLEPGAIDADCEDCHTLPSSHAGNDPHSGKLHCTACHSEGAISCYNCHFESQVEGHNKRARTQLKNFIILVNRTKDNKVGVASFQSLTYQGNSFYAMAPFTPHATILEGRGCGDCHQNMGTGVPAITDYNDDGILKFVTFNESDSSLSYHQGIVPLPYDYETSFRMDFITYNGDPNDPVAPSKNWSPIGEDLPDAHQLFFATPLSKAQMNALGMDTTLVGIEDADSDIPTEFTLAQNYPNPFNPSTQISYTVPFNSYVELSVYDMKGQLVETLVSGQQSYGSYTVTFNAENIASGIYFYQLTTPKSTISKKMMLLK